MCSGTTSTKILCFRGSTSWSEIINTSYCACISPLTCRRVTEPYQTWTGALSFGGRAHPTRYLWSEPSTPPTARVSSSIQVWTTLVTYPARTWGSWPHPSSRPSLSVAWNVTDPGFQQTCKVKITKTRSCFQHYLTLAIVYNLVLTLWLVRGCPGTASQHLERQSEPWILKNTERAFVAAWRFPFPSSLHLPLGCGVWLKKHEHKPK